MDRLFFMVMIFWALYILSKRGINWPQLVAKNWPIALFYGYFLISVLWADSSVSSFKRWFKDLGNVFVALVILTEPNFQQGFRSVFVRCAYLWMPLSIVFVRYFPELGRRYTRGGGLEVTGVTFQKNSLGAMVLVCGLVLIWDWLERSRPELVRQQKFERYFPVAVLLVGFYLLHLCDSKTSIACLVLGGAVLAAVRLPLLRKRIGALGGYALMAIIVFFAIDAMFGIKETVVSSMGRDMTFTGRTDVWREIFALKTDPLIGTGFCSFWSDRFYQDQLPNWVAFSAHNGYIEMWIDGGWIGIFFLALLLVATALRINADLSRSGNYALIRFAVLIATLVGNFSESHYGRMSPLWFLFLLTALEMPGMHKKSQRAPQRSFQDRRPTVEPTDFPDWPHTRPSYR